MRIDVRLTATQGASSPVYIHTYLHIPIYTKERSTLVAGGERRRGLFAFWLDEERPARRNRPCRLLMLYPHFSEVEEEFTCSLFRRTAGIISFEWIERRKSCAATLGCLRVLYGTLSGILRRAEWLVLLGKSFVKVRVGKALVILQLGKNFFFTEETLGIMEKSLFGENMTLEIDIVVAFTIKIHKFYKISVGTLLLFWRLKNAGNRRGVCGKGIRD